MKYQPPLLEGQMVRRYKRFLSDVKLLNGEEIVMHCPNTGAMLGCVYPGSPVYFSTHSNKSRKYKHTLEIVQDTAGELMCVNPLQANRVVGEVLREHWFEPLAEQIYQAEIGVPDEKGRFDFGNESTYIEVKSVTYSREKWGVFPDAESVRATRHVKALIRRVKAGDRGVLVFCVMHTGINQVTIAADIDPNYYNAVKQALDDGVEIYALKFDVDQTGITFLKQIPFVLNPEMPA